MLPSLCAPPEPKADAGATGAEEEPAAAAAAAPLALAPLLLLLLLLLLAAPFAVVANRGSLYDGTLTKPEALPGLEEEEQAPSASASTAAIPSVKGVATLF